MNERMAKLEHALIDVRNLDRSLEFYRKMLPGWVVRWEGRTMEGARWVHFGPPGGGQPGYLSLYETPEAGRLAGEEALRIEHVGFAHADVGSLLELTAASGIRPNDQVDDGKYRRAYFLDPDGHQLEFVQRLDGG